MKVVGTLLLVFSLTIAQLAFDFWWRKLPLRVTTTVDFGKQGKEAPRANPDRPGYVGMRIQKNVVDHVYSGSPAEEAGLLPGDLLIDVDEASVLRQPAEKVAEKLRGDIGAKVDIVFLRDGKLFRVMPARALPVPEEAGEIAAESNPDDAGKTKTSPLTEGKLVQAPLRIADMKTKNFSIKTGIKAQMLTKEIMQKALTQEQKRLGIEAGNFGDSGTIKKICSGDFTGDGKIDAAVVVATARADCEQLDLVAAGIENGQVTLFGAVPLGAGGADTWDEQIKIDSGMIEVDLAVGGRDEPPPQEPVVSWRFKVNQGKLIECL